jgi:RimJ/RimL family protein N-acetyltransferase
MGTGTITMNKSTGGDSLAFPIKTRLRDGTKILIRPLLRTDREDILRGFEKLSLGSRRFRFLTPIHKLSPYQLSSLIDVDQMKHVAIGVRDTGRLGKPGIAVARFVRLDEEPSAAEFAITVIDEYQNRGLGTLLTGLLVKAAHERGIEVLRGFLLDDNLAMIRLLERFGAAIRRESGNVLQADLPVDRNAPAVQSALTAIDNE